MILNAFLFFSFLGLLSGLARAADEIRDVQPPVDLPSYEWIIVAVLLVLAVVAWLLFHWWKQPKSRAAAFAEARLTDWEKAFARLKELRAADLLARGDVNGFYFQLSGILRVYIEERFAIRAPEMTTEEFLISLKDAPQLSGLQKNTLKEFLISCDMIKFARYAPPPEAADKAFELVWRFVEETRLSSAALSSGESDN
ncbi:MAG: hypothetical protein HQL23_06460 [Candidatus Omnitrophica bacterium]|nr:hypothetical protein [Candidatus Omnitrophota bacterium]